MFTGEEDTEASGRMLTELVLCGGRVDDKGEPNGVVVGPNIIPGPKTDVFSDVDDGFSGSLAEAEVEV